MPIVLSYKKCGIMIKEKRKIANSIKTAETDNKSIHQKGVFIFLAGMNFWEGLFDNVNIKFISNILRYQVINFSCIFMTIIIPKELSKDMSGILKQKEELIQLIADDHGVRIEFSHIRGRTIMGIYTALKEILIKTRFYQKKFIWGSNYFNCFLGTLLKQRMPNTRIHFEMMGLVPEEELSYSESHIISSFSKFLILRILCRINLKSSDSISVVSNRFKNYMISKYGIDSSRISDIPCFYDDKVFHFDDELRKKFRRKYQITDQQKLLLYSGMLQKWQMPDVLFDFFKNLQQQDEHQNLRFMIATFDREKARHFAAAYGIRDMIVDTASGSELNGVYNAADIGIATRSEDWVSKVSSPVKIPEYLATQNSLILLESIGDFGLDMNDKKYAIVKKSREELLKMNISEIFSLQKPDHNDMADILNNYSVGKYVPVLKKIFDQHCR
jgi:glycosyltransferase involved in cell wall biosynthesis